MSASPEMSEPKFSKYMQALKRNQERAAKKNAPAGAEEEQVNDTVPCCQGEVHIAYRGVSDGRTYMTYNRTYGELKYFRPIGLKVFCADCRRRLV